MTTNYMDDENNAYEEGYASGLKKGKEIMFNKAKDLIRLMAGDVNEKDAQEKVIELLTLNK